MTELSLAEKVKRYNASKEGRQYKCTQDDWVRFYGDENLWKNTEFPENRGESPTVSTFVAHHIDEPDEEWAKAREDALFAYSYQIAHIRGFHGKGFMAKRVKRAGRVEWDGNGEIFYGTDAAAYNKASLDGRSLVASALKKDEETYAEIDRQKECEEELDALLEEYRPLKESKGKDDPRVVELRDRIDEIFAYIKENKPLPPSKITK